MTRLIATTGLKIALILGLSALTWRTIQKMTAILNHQTNNLTQESLEILEQLLSRNSSLFSITEESYRELAAKSGHSLKQIKAESAYNTAVLLLIFSQFRETIISNEYSVETKLQKHLQFYQKFRELIVPRLSLMYPIAKNDIERFLLRTQNFLTTYHHLDWLTKKAVQFGSLFSEKYREALRIEQLSALIKKETDELLQEYQQINLETYPWREATTKELNRQTRILFNQYLETLPEEKKPEIYQLYQQHYLEYLEEVGSGDEDYDWDNLESYWNEEDPKIIEAAQQMFEERKLTLQKKEKIREIERKRGREEEYNFMTRQSYLFYKNLPKLIKSYSGLYIWFEDEKVKDFDEDEVILCGRVIRSDEVRARKVNAIYTHRVPTLN